MFTLPQAMPSAFLLLVFSWLLRSTTGSCPEGYKCHLERETYVLVCEEHLDLLRFLRVNSTIKDVPAGVTHLKINCTERRTLIKLTFANISNVQQLSLHHLNLVTCGKDMFRGITHLSYLIMNQLTCRRFENNSFNGLTNLRSLTIKHLDELKYMHPDMLTPLVSLQSLSFRYVGSKTNELKYEHYGRILGGINSTSFQTLVLYAIRSAHHRETLNLTDLFRHGSVGSTLKHLEIGRNNIDNIIGSPATTLPVLENMSLSENLIVASRGSRSLSPFLIEILKHPRLKTLHVTGMRRVMPEIHSNAGISLNADQDCTQSINITLGAHFRSMSFSNSTLISDSKTSSFRVCVSDPHRSLTFINLSNIRCTSSIKTSVAKLRALEHIDLRNASLRGLAWDTLSNMPNLTVLLLGKNNIGHTISSDTASRIFHKNNNLLELDLSACQLTHIPHNEFTNLRQLQTLDVSSNKLQHFHVDLHAMKKLTVLNLSDNKLSTLSAKIREALDEMAAVKVDISGNPLFCLCNNTDFVTWSHASKVTFLNKLHTFCTGKDNSTELLFNFDSEALLKTCRPDTGWYLAVLLPLGIVFIGIPMLIYVVYRRKCVYCCSRIHVYNMSPDDKLDHVAYERDAFICYNSSDRVWVCNVLLKRLENSHISTIIHQRDFLPGSILEESIRESIDKCRYTVLILSPDFLSSNWCLLEMHIARRRSHNQRRKFIVPIILREFPMSKLSRTLVDILQKSYLKWSDNPDEQVDFWDKLVTKLKRGGNIKPLKT